MRGTPLADEVSEVKSKWPTRIKRINARTTDVAVLHQKTTNIAGRTAKRPLPRSSADAAMPVAQPVKQPGAHAIDALSVSIGAVL